MTEAERWQIYARKMRIIEATAKTPEEYERRQQEILRELGL